MHLIADKGGQHGASGVTISQMQLSQIQVPPAVAHAAAVAMAAQSHARAKAREHVEAARARAAVEAAAAAHVTAAAVQVQAAENAALPSPDESEPLVYASKWCTSLDCKSRADYRGQHHSHMLLLLLIISNARMQRCIYDSAHCT